MGVQGKKEVKCFFTKTFTKFDLFHEFKILHDERSPLNGHSS